MTQGNVLPLPRWTLIVHGLQIILAIIILGLDAYGIHYIAYNALIFSLVTCILTLGICAYIIGTTLFLNKLYNAYIVLALHLFMIIFWIVDLGLVANLARLWSNPLYAELATLAYTSDYDYYFDDYSVKRRSTGSLHKRDTTTGAYYGALCAGAVFAAAQFALWILSAVFVAMYLNKRRSEATPATGQPPVETKHETVPPPQQQQQQPQPQYQQSPQPYPVQPHYPQQQPQQQYNPYPQDPVSREATVSPVSSAPGYHTGGFNPNVPEMAHGYPGNASELPQNR
ncbi:hypothetical protein M011DRAFT_50150 [Sporormia fimetaria CBS 119925]|uniref:MARVEL domain-containing protein n=1 Tax=Sporormia fimetaria CBS 119925 TaxID=1340428 RepID=A0A6A6VAL1_9PLEO|nr:hypothetical protein M011DRAFT_50150 [Sporormia fimetaria CBS 119925]